MANTGDEQYLIMRQLLNSDQNARYLVKQVHKQLAKLLGKIFVHVIVNNFKSADYLKLLTRNVGY